MAHAEESQFAYVYTTDLLPKGAKEIEQWMTWRHQKIGGYYDQVEGRTEVEYGLTDRLQVALYGNYAWARAYHNGPYGATTPPEQFADKDVDPDARWSDKRFVGVSAEAIYRVLSPYTDGVGLAFYVEPTIGPQFKELETKVNHLINAQLARGPYLLGDRFTAADVLWGAALHWMVGFKLVPETPVIRAYVDRIQARPAIQRAQALDAALAAELSTAAT
ncbi:glutathione S-transferase C-terminal domain-containing protein [Ralstonia solanacearum]|uniref:glutathione S-transferase C-terminal domain-containing protein n=1 Tax=Ralstonia solanacearum TaxID=305 RepID=UPI001E2D9068|nr:glutathione S-transferase C-terminal domain-containing protein [Ralstonia solanacearum]